MERSLKKLIHSVADGRSMVKSVFRNDLTGILIYFNKKGPKVASYILSKDKKDDLVLVAKTKMFVVTYTIKTSCESILELELRTSMSKTYQRKEIESLISSDYGYVYFIKSQFGYKIGCAKDYKTRIKTLGVIMPFEYELTHIIRCVNYQELENVLHKAFKPKRIRGEWFSIEESDFLEVNVICKNYNTIIEKIKPTP